MRTSGLKRTLQGIATGGLLLAMTAGAANSALIQPTAQTRSVSGSASAQDLSGSASDSNSDQALDFTPFVSGVSAAATLNDAEGTGGGIQDSEIQADAIVASGSTSATAESFEEEGRADGSGSSIMIVDFTLLAQANY